MHDVNAFEDTVSAYPAITVLRNGRQGPAHVVEAIDGFDAADGRTVEPMASRWARGSSRRRSLQRCET